MNKDFYVLEFKNDSVILLNMIYVEKGMYRIGTNEEVPSGDREKEFKVSLTNGFWLGQYPITNAHWQFVMGGDISKDKVNFPKLDVSWFEAIEFCKKLNSSYPNDLPDGYEFYLPSEIQWECAARAGEEGELFLPPLEISEITDFGWFEENSNSETHSVGLKRPNPWGFYDMVGNGFEWCSNSFRNYPSIDCIDWPIEDDINSDLKVLRSSSARGTYRDPSFRVTFRMYSSGIEKAGFRLCLRNMK